MLKNENYKYLKRVIYTDAQCDQFIEAIKDGYTYSQKNGGIK